MPFPLLGAKIEIISEPTKLSGGKSSHKGLFPDSMTHPLGFPKKQREFDGFA